MTLVGEITKFPHEWDFADFKSELDFSRREKLVRQILNELLGDNAAVDWYKSRAFILANSYFREAVECYLYTQYNGAMVMLRNSIDAALWFSYCRKPLYDPNKIEPRGDAPNENYDKYSKKWEWNYGIKKAIYELNLLALFDSNVTAQDEIYLIRDRGNFSAHLAERQAKEFKKYSNMTEEERKDVNYKIKTTAEGEEVLDTLQKAAKYLIYIRNVYFEKYPNSLYNKA